MSLEVYKVTSNDYRQLVVESVEWSGGRWRQPRKIVVKSLAKSGQDKFPTVSNGDTIMFKYDGKELFRGTVFETLAKKGAEEVEIIAYDLIRYLVRNEDVYTFENVTLSDIFRRVCRDFSIPTGTVANTGYVFKKLLFLDDTLLIDMLIRGINETHAQTNRLFYIRSDKGKLSLLPYPTPTTLQVLSDDSNILTYDYKESIEETATNVKMRATIDEETVTATANDAAGTRLFGRLQHVEHVSVDITRAQLNQRAQTRLQQKKGVKRTLSDLTVMANTELVSAMPVRIEIKELELKKNMYIDSDTHIFEEGKHLANLSVIDRNYVTTGE